MMLLNRLRQSRFKFNAVSNDFRRFYSLNPAPVIANQHISLRKPAPIVNYSKVIVQDEQLVCFQKVRFYAKAAKVPQKAERDDSEPRMNEEITVQMIRLVIDQDNHCIISRQEALARAKSLKLDLVEVDKFGKPPVCKIFDYKKQKYLQQTKEKERSKKKCTLRSESKEVKFGGKITPNDMKIKADMVKRLMEKGYRVKCTAADTTEGVNLKALLSKFTAMISDAIEEHEPKVDSKQAYVVVRHVKYGAPNKSGKKSSAPVDSPQTEEDSVKDAPTKKSDWAAFDGDDGDADPILDIDDKEKGQLKSSMQEISFSADRNPVRAAEPTRTPVGMNGPGTMNTQPTYPNQGNQTRFRPSLNTPPPTRAGHQVEAPARGIPKQDSPVPTDQNSPVKSYGIFSTPKGNIAGGNRNPGDRAAGQSSPAKSYGIFSTPKVDTAAAAGNRNPGTATASSPAAADSRTGQARYGMFSAEEKERQARKQ